MLQKCLLPECPNEFEPLVRPGQAKLYCSEACAHKAYLRRRFDRSNLRMVHRPVPVDGKCGHCGGFLARRQWRDNEGGRGVELVCAICARENDG